MRLLPRAVLLLPLLIGLAASGCRKSAATPAAPAAGASDAVAPAAAGPATLALPTDPNATAATVDGVTLTQHDLEQQAQAFLASQGAQIPPAQMQAALTYFQRRIVQTFVNKTLLLNEARRLKLSVSAEDQKKFMAPIEAMAEKRGTTLDAMFAQAPMGEKAARQELADSMLIEKLIESEVRSKVKLADAEVDTALAEQEKTRTAARAEIDAIRAQLLAGTNFEALATERSADKGSATRGGDLGLFGRGQMVKPFEDAAFSQKVGEIGPVVETQYGYHIIKVTAHNAAAASASNAVPTPETVQASHILILAPAGATRDAVRKELEDKQLSPAMETYVEGLRAKATIKTIFDQPKTAAPGPATVVTPAAKPAAPAAK